MSQNLMSVDRWSIILYKGSFKNYVSRQERVSDQSNVHAYKVQKVLHYKGAFNIYVNRERWVGG